MNALRKLSARTYATRSVIDAVNKAASQLAVKRAHLSPAIDARIKRIEDDVKYIKDDMNNLDNQIVELKYALSRVYVRLSILEHK